MRLHPQNGFTLLELLIVIGIMGLLGTVSVSGFRGIRKGMEERGALQAVDEFIRSAYRRSVIDRVPTAVYFWNEAVSDETVGKKLVVVGRAVAVRCAGRISKIDGDLLVDEFGDLAYETVTDETGEEKTDDASHRNDPGRYLYKMGDANFNRSVVSSSTVKVPDFGDYLISGSTEKDPRMYPLKAYGYYLREKGGIDWNVGDPYGLEFAELTLPKNYVFGNNSSLTKVGDSIEKVKVLVFRGLNTSGGEKVSVAGLQLEKSGDVAFKSIGSSNDPMQERKNR